MRLLKNPCDLPTVQQGTIFYPCKVCNIFLKLSLLSIVPQLDKCLKFIAFCDTKARFPHVLRIGDFNDLQTSWILTTSGNTPSQMVGDFYYMIRIIGSISTLKVLSHMVPNVRNFYNECEHEIWLSGTGRSLMIGDFYDEGQNEIYLSGTSECLTLFSLAAKA